MFIGFYISGFELIGKWNDACIFIRHNYVYSLDMYIIIHTREDFHASLDLHLEYRDV